MKPKLRPTLIDFLAGYPGPAETLFRGGSITVVAALVYEDGIRLEWRMPSRPDLSWMEDVEVDTPQEPAKEWNSRAATDAMRDGFRGAERLRELWARARLTDDHGGALDLRSTV